MAVLRETREKAGISQVQLGKKLKRTRNYINLVEKGRRVPNLLELWTIIDAIGADPIKVHREMVKRFRLKHPW